MLETSGVENWEPPEAVRAAFQSSLGRTQAPQSTWKCSICTLINQSDVDKCNACGTPKVVSMVHEAEESAAAAASALSKANVMSAKKKKGKKVTMSFQDVNRTPDNTVSGAWGTR
jgi:hypothetical protein